MVNLWGLLVSLAVGALAGWIAGKLMNSEGSVLRNILLGIVGGGVATALFKVIGISFSGIIGDIIASVIGACLVIWLARLITKK